MGFVVVFIIFGLLLMFFGNGNYRGVVILVGEFFEILVFFFIRCVIWEGKEIIYLVEY